MNIEKYKSDFGKRLAFLRKMKNVSQIQLCGDFSKKYGLLTSERSLRRYEDGENLPSIEILFAYRDYFNVSFEFLMNGSEASDDNSFTYKDSFKRLNRLLFSTLFSLNKIVDQNDPLFGKHVLVAVDEETNAYLDKLENALLSKNLCFERGEDDGLITIKTLDKQIEGFSWLNRSVYPNENRLRAISESLNEDFEELKIKKLKRLERKRKAAQE